LKCSKTVGASLEKDLILKQETSALHYYEIGVNAPLNKAFTYHSVEPLQEGTLVQAPFSGRKINGVILNKNTSSIEFKTKSMDAFDDVSSQLSSQCLKWAKWLSDYYCHPLGQVLNLFFPPLKYKTPKEKKLKINLESDLTLGTEQQKVFTDISKDLKSFKVHLIHGVTGSGKTEIYLQLIKKVISENKQALVLVPEISLTPQLEQRFKKRFGEDKIAVIHSQVSPRKRSESWYDISLEKKPILIGARSALFSNFKNLGIVVIDEEHDSSFKQDEKFKYNGRDSAIVLAQIWNCPIILGSATPSLETWNKAKTNKFEFHELKNRVFEQNPPEVQIINLKESAPYKDQPYWYTEILHHKIKEHLDKNQQVALFLNRRGMAQTIQCIDCAHQIKCPNCDITLTLHHNTDCVCHYCGYHERLKTKCPDCGSDKLFALGLGTEKVEEVIRFNFPDKTIVRADRDTIENRNEMQEFIDMVESEKAQILIGTQMISKGLDFPKLSFVGILLADVGLNIPDFRSNERVFQLISQVSGRAGRRKDLKGEVLIQTYNPEHPVFKHALVHDYPSFAEEELEERKIFGYPPFSRLASLRVQSPDQGHINYACQWVTKKAEHLKKNVKEYEGLEILGPMPAPIQKIKNQFRNLFLFKSEQNQLIQKFFQQITHNLEGLPPKTKISLDVDPINML
jgi:primosomal protein N' (replication factor Y) (superfamily II helicase)